VKALALALSVCLLLGCGEKLTTAQRIIGRLQEMKQAAEAGRHFKFMDYLTDDFSAQRGLMGRREFHRFMIFQINRNHRLKGRFFPIFVSETDARHAEAHFRLLVTGGKGILPEHGQLYEVETNWRLTDGAWLLRRADWKPVFPR
jgi:hypothetical protein